MNDTTPIQRVRRGVLGDVLVLAIDHPPVNALNADVRWGLLAGIQAAESLSAVKAVLIVGTGRAFIAGADIREFGKPPLLPLLPEVCQRIEDCNKPVIAAIHGAALGGGLEIALSAHYRLALDNASLGLPEVTLGLLPGAGGTQRTPRLIGTKAALDLILAGRPIDAQQALRLGLVDRVTATNDALVAGLAFANELIGAHAPVRRTCDARALHVDGPAHRQAIAAARQQMEREPKDLISPRCAIDAVEAALDEPFERGLQLERSLFLQCLNSWQRRGLVHAFFAEREAARFPGLGDAKPLPLEAVGVVGGGTMGAGITVALLDGGLAVTMIERDDIALAQGHARIEKVYEGLVSRGRLATTDKSARMARLTGSTSYESLSDADLVIEAVFEDGAVKQSVFEALSRVCKPGAVLATNTSYLDIDAIAAGTSHPASVLGLHFFSPANVMKLLEVVVPANASPETVATGLALAKKLRKIPVKARVCDGFIGNRMLAVYRAAADFMMEDGASPYQIDRALRDFGFAMGPYQVIDLAGGDIGWANRKRKAATRDPRARYVQIGDRLCERGWFGQKTGRGYYRYPEGSRQGEPDPEVEAIIAEERARAGITPRIFNDEEIVRRYLAAMINEGANVLKDGVAQRPLDIDVVLVHGYGFPRYRGGPMKHADEQGLARILADLRRFAAEDPLFWRPSPLLVGLAERGADFASLNAAF
ncbi:3-hydroxyacyl-CoA dehydrogenase NAD-binding domain-containing protein [Dyella terrae]|uniref:3-hydroxyacyl-CoA dehydrogenase NAD-binding domain-containing protein n=1 Tax=Dyella terrae TaxID=522259 RepID=UPI001EFCA708|nr:3-hydroxyacyl-CoA dehydrogenase NAD-binding domain-containing protein [Dyella terrae]ULU24175.1 enoyl-CoA hydratase/isomerase family protein [Dyella terrae]